MCVGNDLISTPVVNLCAYLLNPLATPFVPNDLSTMPINDSVLEDECSAIANLLNYSTPVFSELSVVGEVTHPCANDLSTPHISACDTSYSVNNSLPCVNDISTPNISIASTPNISIIDDTDGLLSSHHHRNAQDASYEETGNRNGDNIVSVLNKIRTKHINNVVIGHLNINSLPNKFDALSLIIEGNLDILVIGETKLDGTFSDRQFIINGFAKPYRLDRNRNGGGVIIYVRADIPSKQLIKHKFSKNIEALFIEINLRKNNLLLVGTYHSTHPQYGTSDIDYFEQMGLALDVYSN